MTISSQNFFLCLGFLISGTLSTLACQMLIYEGAAETSSMLIPFFNYVGLVFSGFLSDCSKKRALDDQTEPQTIVPPVPVRCLTPPLTSASPADNGLPPRPRTASRSSQDPGASRKTPVDFSEGLGIRSEGVRKPRAQRTGSVGSASSVDATKEAAAPEAVIVAVTSSVGSNAVVTAPRPEPFRVGCFRFSEMSFIVFVTLLDVGGLILILLAIKFAGSGLFEVVYSSIVAWSAVLAWYFLGKRTAKMQMVGIAVVIIGLASDTIGEMFHGDGLDVNLADIFVGGLFSLASALVYALSFVVSEGVMTCPNPPKPKKIASYMGIIATSVCSVYVVCVTVPNWNKFVSDPVKQAEGRLPVIFATYAVMMVAQMLHIVLYFRVVGKVGAVTTGVLGGLRSAILFLVSGVMFCSRQESQCLTPTRCLAACIVVAGVIVYSRGQVPPESRSRKPVALSSADALAEGNAEYDEDRGVPANIPSAYRHSPLTTPDLSFLSTPRLF